MQQRRVKIAALNFYFLILIISAFILFIRMRCTCNIQLRYLLMHF